MPRTRGAGGPVHHRERVHHRRDKVAAGPAQLIVVALGAIVLIGCVLAIIFKMNEGGAPVDSITDPGTTQKPAAASRTTNAGDVHPALAKPPAELPKITNRSGSMLNVVAFALRYAIASRMSSIAAGKGAWPDSR